MASTSSTAIQRLRRERLMAATPPPRLDSGNGAEAPGERAVGTGTAADGGTAAGAVGDRAAAGEAEDLATGGERAASVPSATLLGAAGNSDEERLVPPCG
jgi:hypothetical protein